MRAALASLPPRQRATLVLRFYCDLPSDETAACPGADTSALTISASIVTGPAVCDSGGGQSSYVNRLGVQWLYVVTSLPGDTWQRLCATAPVGGLTGVDITMDMNNPASDAPLPGSAQLGGTLGVLGRLHIAEASRHCPGADPSHAVSLPGSWS